VCPPVCPSVTRRYCVETAARLELIFCIDFPRPILRCFREIRVSPKIWVLPTGTLSQTLDLENFATAHHDGRRVRYKLRLQADWCLRHIWRRRADGRCAWHPRYGSNSTGSISRRFVVDLLYSKLYIKSNQWSLSLYSERRRLPTLGMSA